MPDLVLLDPMQGGEVVPGEQKVDRRGKAAVARETPGQGGPRDQFLGAIGFAIIAAFRVAEKLQSFNPFCGIFHLDLRSRPLHLAINPEIRTPVVAPGWLYSR